MKVPDIPTDIFYQIISELRSEEWKAVLEYAGFYAGTDYDLVVLKRQGVKLKFEWDNWLEGSVEGPNTQVQELRARYSLK